MKLVRSLLLTAGLAAVACINFGCEINSSNGFIRNIAIDYSGFYSNPNSDRIVTENSGNRIRSLDLRQSGDRLEAVDNNGLIWRGRVGDPSGGRATFNLDGRTSSGVEASFSGTLSSSDSGTTSTGSVTSTQGTMTGTYIEPDRFSTFFAQATIPGTISNDGGNGGGGSGVTISATATTISTTNGTSTLSASGGTAPYSWVILSGGGSLSATSTGEGVTTVYSRAGAANGSAIIRATDSAAASDSVTITLQ